MAILNYTTQIDSMKTITEIMVKLSKFGANGCFVQNDDKGRPIGLSFSIIYNEQMINFQLPCNWLGILELMNKDHKVPIRLKNNDQALRVSWRIIKDWVEAQLAIVEAKMATVQEVFFPYAQLSTGQTLFKSFEESKFKMLAAG